MYLVNNNFGAGLSFDVTIALVEGGYLGDSMRSLVNVPPVDRTVTTDHSGFLYKQGHGVKSWKYRRFLLQGRSLKYYDDTVLKGTVDIKDAHCEDCSAVECNAPKDSFPFKVITPVNTWFLYALTASERLMWRMVIDAKVTAIRQALNGKNMLRRGYLKKEGHMIRNWKKRFFVLDMGLLVYYERESAGNKKNPPVPPFGENEKGRLRLSGATVTREDAHGRLGVSMNRIYLSGKNAEDLLLEADTEVAADVWFQDIKAHIEFADRNPHLVDIDDNDAVLSQEQINRHSETETTRRSSARSSMFW